MDYKELRSSCAASRGGRIAERAGAHPPKPEVARAKGGMKHFAHGGAVEEEVEGHKPKHRADRARGGKVGRRGSHVAVNVVVPQAGGAGMPTPPHPPMGLNMPPGAGLPLGAMPHPPMPVPGAPPGAMPPGMAPPMARPPGMKRGGAAKSPKMIGGAGGGLGRIEKSKMAKVIGAP